MFGEMTMRRSRLLLPVLTLLFAAVASDATAQITARARPSQRGWLGFQYVQTTIRYDGERRPAIVVEEVMDDSPAEEAGLAPGDTIIAINGLRVTESFMESLGETLEPGDDVTVRVVRRGREREYALTAARRPPDNVIRERESSASVIRCDTDRGRLCYSYRISPDSLRSRIEIYLDSARYALDSLRGGFRLERLPGGRAWMWSSDSVMVGPRFRYGLWMPDSLRIEMDSLTVMLPRLRGGIFQMDSLMRQQSGAVRALREMPRGIYTLRGDTVWRFEAGPEGALGVVTFGLRAVGGAELRQLEPELGEYFGTDRGVLVLRVPENTPADRAGLQAGDVIVGVNGSEIETLDQLRRAIQRRGRGESIKLEILRRNSRRTIELRND